jgi:glycosyltransferase involved in cell wall biosynthesis
MLIYLLPRYPNWSETYLAQELHLLRQSGLPLTAAALWSGKGEAGTEAVTILDPSATPTGGSSTATAPKQPVIRGAARRLLSLKKHSGLLAGLTSLIREHNAAHIHSATLDLPGLLAMTAAKDCRISYSLSGHAADVACCKFGLEALTREAVFVDICNDHAAAVLRNECPQLGDRLHVIRHGVDLSGWQMAHAPDGDAPRLLFVGRLVEKKNVSLAIETLAALVEHGHNATLRVIGEGPDGEPAKALAESLGVADKVAWLGVLPRCSVQSEMAAAHLLLVTGRDLVSGDSEGIPNVVVEAMAVGLPVVATECGGIGEVLSEATGWPTGDNAQALASGCDAALNDSSGARARAAAARRVVDSTCDALRLIDTKIELLQRALNGRT